MRRAGIWLTALLAAVLVAPLLVTSFGAISHSEWYGLRSEGVRAAGTAGLFRYVLGTWGPTLLVTARLAALVVPIALLVGAPAAWAFRRLPFPGARGIEALAMTPLSFPGIALAVALLMAASRLPRFPLLVAGHLAYTLPLVVQTVGNALVSERRELELAARSLGATPSQMLRWVTLPRLAPALVLAALLAFAVSWGEFNVSFLLATPLVQTFPAGLYMAFTANSFPVAAAATIVFLLPVIPAFLAIQALGGEEFRRGQGA